MVVIGLATAFVVLGGGMWFIFKPGQESAPFGAAVAVGLEGKVLFSSERNEPNPGACRVADCNFDLYIVGADGSGLSQLTSGPDADFGGDVSPDGHRVVFPRAVQGQARWQLIQMGIDGMNQRVLVESTRRMNFPRWSPSGNQIVFARQSGSKTHLFLLDLSTERVTRLAARNAPRDSFSDMEPAWAPDGRSVIFVRIYDSDPYHGTIEEEQVSTGRTHVISEPGQPSYPTWAPSGGSIAYSNTVDGNEDIYVVSPRDGTPIQLTDAVGFDGLLSWSPDGDHLAFTSTRNGTEDIFIMRSDGSEQSRLDTQGSRNGAPDWFASPMDQ
jgi:Tol biopolymer transport system component